MSAITSKKMVMSV